MEVEHFLLSKIALQVLSDADGTYSHRGTREQQVTDFQGHEATDIGNDIIYPEQHIRCMATFAPPYHQSSDGSPDFARLHPPAPTG